MYLGVTHLGIVTFQGNKRTHLFKWFVSLPFAEIPVVNHNFICGKISNMIER